MFRMPRSLMLIVAIAVVSSVCGDAEPAPTISIPGAAPRTAVTVPPSSTATTLLIAPADTVPPTTTSTTTTIPIEEVVLELELVASGFSQPVLVTSPPGDRRLFVVDQPGRIWVIDGGDPEVYLDIRGDVDFRGERGLLGLAFEPAFATTGRFFVDYTDKSGDTVVASFTSDPAANVAEPASRVIHLEVGQPAANHNGGNIVFGPDGHLWIGMGDGGGANDAFGNGQQASTLLGSLLRISPTPEGFDVPSRSEAISDDVADGVWAIGVRNPWRFAFDGDLLYVADVGQARIEEITVVDVRVIDDDARKCLGCIAVPNFGWPIQEGTDCFARSGCDTDGLLQPVVEYTHADGCSITGGFVYRGDDIPSLLGHYFYGDFCNGWVRSFFYDTSDGSVGDEIEWFELGTVSRLTSFGQDSSGELYVMSISGSVWKIVSRTS